MLWKRFKELGINQKAKSTSMPDSLNYADKINNAFLAHSRNKLTSDDTIITLYNSKCRVPSNSIFQFNIVSEDIVFKNLLDIKSLSTDAALTELILKCYVCVVPTFYLS